MPWRCAGGGRCEGHKAPAHLCGAAFVQSSHKVVLYTKHCLVHRALPAASSSNITTALEVYDNMHVKRKEKIMRFSD